MQQIYRRTIMTKISINLQATLLKSDFAWDFFCKFAAYFWTLFCKTNTGGLFLKS